jgi:hypothetical protein
LHYFQEAGADSTKGWLQLQTTTGYRTCATKISSLKDWKHEFFFVEMPRDYPLRRHFNENPRMRLQTAAEAMGHFSRHNLHLNDYEQFAANYFANNQSWLPPPDYVCRGSILQILGMVPAQGEGTPGPAPAPFLLLCLEQYS